MGPNSLRVTIAEHKNKCPNQWKNKRKPWHIQARKVFSRGFTKIEGACSLCGKAIEYYIVK